MLEISHLVAWGALVLLAFAAVRMIWRGALAGGVEDALLGLGATFAGLAVLLHAAATKDALIAVLALVFLALAVRSASRARVASAPSDGAPPASFMRPTLRRGRPSLRLLRGGRSGASAPGQRSGILSRGERHQH